MVKRAILQSGLFTFAEGTAGKLQTPSINDVGGAFSRL